MRRVALGQTVPFVTLLMNCAAFSGNGEIVENDRE